MDDVWGTLLYCLLVDVVTVVVVVAAVLQGIGLDAVRVGLFCNGVVICWWTWL